MFIPEETIVGGEGRRMGGCQHQMLVPVDEGPLLLGVSSPKDEHQVFPLFGQGTDGGIGKLLPTLALVRTCLMGTDGERGIEQEHPLVGPTGEVSARRDVDAQVALDFLEDVLKGRREGHAVVHGETESVCLSGTVVRVLPNNHHLSLMERTEVEGIENEFPRRIDGRCAVFCTHKIGEADEIVLFKFGGKLLFPAFFYLYIHGFLVLMV